MFFQLFATEEDPKGQNNLSGHEADIQTHISDTPKKYKFIFININYHITHVLYWHTNVLTCNTHYLHMHTVQYLSIVVNPA